MLFPPLSPQTRGCVGHRRNSTFIGSGLMDQPLEPWVSNGGTGVVAAAFSNQGQAVSHGPGQTFFFLEDL